MSVFSFHFIFTFARFGVLELYSAEGLTQGKFLPDKILICQSSKFTHFTAACLELWQCSAHCLLGFMPLNILAHFMHRGGKLTAAKTKGKIKEYKGPKI